MTQTVKPPSTTGAPPEPAGIRVHVGCGPVTPEGWDNLDASWNLLAARVPGLRAALQALGIISRAAGEHEWSHHIRYCNVTHGLPYRDGEAAVVYASHVLEHLTRAQAVALVHEAHRVLAPGGVLRLVVPDLERLARLYVQAKTNGGAPESQSAVQPADDFMVHLMTTPDYTRESLPLRLYRAFLDTNSHKWMYDAASLAAVMQQAGFQDVRRCGYLESRYPHIAEVERANRFTDGVCIEGLR